MKIQAAIADLYIASAIALPSARRPIVRLHELILALNLTCLEVAGLTRDAASRKLAERGGLLDEDGGERQSPLAGYLYAVGTDASIFVEERAPVSRRRFAVAHALGHYLLHFRPLLARLSERLGAPAEALDALPMAEPESEPESEPGALPAGQIVLPLVYALDFAGDEPLPTLSQMEIEANRFAAELLMPEPVVRELAARYGPYFGPTKGDNDLVCRLANELLVSRAAMRWRLRSLGLIE